MKYRIIAIPVVLTIALGSGCRTIPTNGNPKGTTGIKDTTGTPPVSSAIDGLVLKGPISPVARQGEINEAPLAGATILISQDLSDRKPISVVSDGNGRFYVKVSPGTYTLTPEAFPGQALPRPEQSSSITVPDNTVVKDTLHYDTGIR